MLLCVGQCVHFLAQAEWCDASVFAEIAERTRGVRDGQFLDESQWEDIAKTLLAAPAGFSLQLPARVAVYDPFRPSTRVGG